VIRSYPLPGSLNKIPRCFFNNPKEAVLDHELPLKISHHESVI
jgi:hypothetical protein